MAEKFTNYTGACSNNSETTIIPVAGSFGRDNGAISEVHSIYLTLSDTITFVDDPEANSDLIDLYIYNGSSRIYLAKAIKIVPNSSFYIEKTITLKATDSLCIQRLIGDHPIHIICSTVDIV